MLYINVCFSEGMLIKLLRSKALRFIWFFWKPLQCTLILYWSKAIVTKELLLYHSQDILLCLISLCECTWYPLPLHSHSEEKLSRLRHGGCLILLQCTLILSTNPWVRFQLSIKTKSLGFINPIRSLYIVHSKIIISSPQDTTSVIHVRVHTNEYIYNLSYTCQAHENKGIKSLSCRYQISYKY